MVMYPWKQPRLNDGYYGRNSSHQYENPDRHMAKGYSGYNDRGRYDNRQRDSPDYRHSRDNSPVRPTPRYSNKLSYIDRNKDRYDKGSKLSPADYRGNKTEVSSRNGDRSHDSEYSRDSNGSKSKEKDQRNELQKTALRVCGDWSEHISGSGKRYYYNCKTEVSKWEKPKEWTLDTPSKSSKKDKDRYSNSSGSGGAKHSSSRHDEKNHRSRESSPSRRDYRYSEKRDKYRTSQTKYESNLENSQRTTGQSGLKTVTDYNSISQERRNDSYRNSDVYNRVSSDRREDNSRQNENRDIRQSVDMDISPDSTPPPQQQTVSSHPISRQLSRTSQTPTSSNYPSLPTPTSTATSLANLPGSTAGVTFTNLSSVLTQLGDQSLQNIDSKKLQQQALHTLQQLQQAISSRKVSIQNAGTTPSPRVAHTNNSQEATPVTQQSPYQQSPQISQKGNTTPLTSEKPYIAPAQGQTTPQRNLSTTATAHTYRSQKTSLDEEPPDKSPGSEKSARPDRNSPTPSQTSSQGAPVCTSSLAAVTQKPTGIQLPASLANYYKEELTGHVLGWQMNHAEKQANRFREDSHSIGSLQSTQLSVDLKKARSEVRAGEINTTLQEQRILFIRQQIIDLERGSKN